jgi:hypothetical protein
MSDVNLIKRAMKEVSKKISSLDIYQVTVVNVETQTYTIKQLNFNKTFENVEVIGLGLGHGKGQLMLLDVNDLVLVGFLMDSLTPYILGNVFNNFMAEPDYKISIQPGEYFITNKTNGAYILIDKDNQVKIKTSTGNGIKLYGDGSFKLLNHDGYGIECDKNGTLTLRGLSINHTQTSGNL